MLIDASHWALAFVIALSVHLAGMMFFEPKQVIQPAQQELTSERIVVRLGSDSGRTTATASLLGSPEESGPVKPADPAPIEEPVNLTQPSLEDTESPIEEVAVSPTLRRSLDVEAAATPASTDVPELDPAREVAVDKSVSTSALMLPADEGTGTKEAVVLAPSVANKSEVSTAAPATPQIDAQREHQINEIIVAPLLEDATEATDPKLTQDQVQNSVDEEIPVHSLTKSIPTDTDQPSTIQPQQQVEIVALKTEVPRLDEVEEVSVSAPSTAVESRPVTSVQIPPTEQVARAITLEELHDISGVSARYAGLLKGWLRENMHYPRAARITGQEGRAIVRFVIDRSGKVSSIRLEQSSGYAILDREAVEMIERADPFPIMPDEMAGSQLELRVPVVFDINQESLIRQIPPIFLE